MKTGRLLYTQLLIVLLSGIAVKGYTQVDFNCAQPLALEGCNHIPNPRFNISIPNFYGNAFMWGNVLQWGVVGCGTSDLNAALAFGSGVPDPLPAAVGTANYASMLSTNNWSGNNGGTYSEGISAKIRSVKAGQQYAFSFFAALTNANGLPSGAYVLKAIFTNCANISPADGSCAVLNPRIYPVLPQKQEIFCARYDGVNDPAWQQYVVSFTATQDWNMLVIYPETIDNHTTDKHSFVHLALPELVPLAPVIEKTNVNCNTTLRATCGVTNATFTWSDPHGNVVGNTPEITVNAATQSGQYSVTMLVPSNPSTNTCSNNSSAITTTVDVPACTPCTGKQISSAYLTYQSDDGILHKKDILADCQNNVVCQPTNEPTFTLDMASSTPNGNKWEIFRDGIPATDLAAEISFRGNYPTNQQTYTPTFTFTGFYEPTTFEFRLTNSVNNLTESITLQVLPQADIDYFECRSNTRPGWITMTCTTQYTTRNTRYQWDFSNAPAGFKYIQPSINAPDIEYFLPTSTYSFNAYVNIINSQYGCDKKDFATLLSEPVTCAALAVAKTTQTVIYPNPVTSGFSVKSEKRIATLAVYSAEGKLLKRFLSTDIHRPFQIDDLSAGLYWVQITYADHSTETKRIIKPNTKQ